MSGPLHVFKYSLRVFVGLPQHFSSVLIFASLAVGQNWLAVRTANKAINNFPCNWPLYKFLLQQYFYSNKYMSSVLLVSRFISSSFALDVQKLKVVRLSNVFDYSANIIAAYFLSSSDKRDFCELDVRPRPVLSFGFSLHIIFVGRFSNFILQLSNAIAIAHLYRASNIYIQISPFLCDLFANLESFCCSSYGVSIHFCEPTEGFILRSFFFHISRKADTLYETDSIRTIVSSFRDATHFPVVKNFNSRLETASIEKNIVIHLRSGDIFRSRNTHPDYGQPPLSFYTCAIEHYSPKFVTLVYEDDANPVTKPLLNYLKCEHLPFTIQSSNLRSDLALLTNASALVISRGTFALGVLLLNDVIKTLYCFNSSQEQDPVFRLHLSRHFYGNDTVNTPVVNEIVDRTGFYFCSVCCGNWKNTFRQRRLMLSYPASNYYIRAHQYV